MSDGTLDTTSSLPLSTTGLSPSMVCVSTTLRLTSGIHIVVRNPASKLTVWPLSRSLAATWEIDVSFSSSGYLDVSVQRVSLCTAMYLLHST